MKYFSTLFLMAVSCHAKIHEEPKKLVFTSCGSNNWSCMNKTDGLSSSIAAVTYKCPMKQSVLRSRYNPSGYNENYYDVIQSENITLDLSEWEKLALSKVKVEGCFEVVLLMHTAERINVDTLIIQDVSILSVRPPVKKHYHHHPHNLAFRNIGFIPKLPPAAILNNGTKEIEFKNTLIGLVHKGAINVHGHLKLFKWTNVTTIAMKEGACSVTMEESAEFEISESSFPRLRPFSILVEEGFVSITNSKFSLIQNGAVRLASVSSFNFTGNEVDGSSGSFYVLSPDVTFSKNIFSDFSGKQLLHWETHKNSDLPNQVTFSFTENQLGVVHSSLDVPLDNDIDTLSSCTSRVSFIERGSNCSTKLDDYPGNVVYTIPNPDISVLNYLVCGNAGLNGLPIPPFAAPTQWDPLELWTPYLCSDAPPNN